MEHTVSGHWRTIEELEAGLPDVRLSPRDVGTLELVVRRPAVDAREVLTHADLGLRTGLVGDTWIQRPSPKTPDGSPHPGQQLAVINSRFAELIAGPDRDAWTMAGDQLYVDLDLSIDGLPCGSRLAIGDRAVLEVTDQPHTGCAKFAARFGSDAHRIVWTDDGKRLRLRGLYARVVVAGTIHPGDAVRVQRAEPPAETASD
jgi:hypothetical protein